MIRRRAFTLLEVILALSLLVLFMGVLFQFYHNSLRNRQRGLASVQEAHLARVLLRQISDEIRACGGFVPGFGPGVIGDRYDLTMQTIGVPSKELFRPRTRFEKELPGQHDLTQVRYFIAWDEDIVNEEGIPLALGLVRQELKTLRQAVIVAGDVDEVEVEQEDEDVERSFKLQLYAPEVKYLEFRYFDGADWHRDWTIAHGNALPQMIRITLGYETQMPDDLEVGFEEDDFEFEDDEIFPRRSYTAYVRLVQADSFFGSRVTRAASDLAEAGI